MRIIEHFASQGIETTVFVQRARAQLPQSVAAVDSGGRLLRKLPFKLVSPFTKRLLRRAFRAAVDSAEPGTIAYFWPNTPADLVSYAKAKGMVCVREMINSPLAHAKPVLDEAYRAAGVQPTHGLTQAMVDRENAELALHDFIFSSNAEVDAALLALGVARDRILSSTFGWTASRFAPNTAPTMSDDTTRFRAVFVGLMNVRKGISTLLEAWEMAAVDGELIMAGAPEPCLQPMIDDACSKPGVRHLGFVSDVASLYRSCDVFVFPTFEEGGPQVTYEAAACGIPVITTPMGAARLIEHDVTGMIVAAGDTHALAEALRKLAMDKPLRRSLSIKAREKVDQFEYRAVGTERAQLLLNVARLLRP
ncbi:hypothetical protein EH31_16860 [Erythrobacter longus]|uniref:Glycosyl transferase family 1 domain-containing protein n=1 Tax=Erythrobacter longus TaxID=1044 RepID=A0A074M2J8_ERYLO|nr:hypothetical protein EH31_16860 [Erythrobacter longus]